MRPIVQALSEDPLHPVIRCNEAGVAVLRKVLDEVQMRLSTDRHRGIPQKFPKKFSSGKIDRFLLEVVLIAPEVDPADPTQCEKV
jgi:hypothetical protein